MYKLQKHQAIFKDIVRVVFDRRLSSPAQTIVRNMVVERIKA